MPKHKYEANERDWSCDPEPTNGKKAKMRRPSIHIAISSEQMKELEVGKSISIKIEGIVKGLHSEDKRSDVDVELVSSEVYGISQQDAIDQMIDS